MEMALTSDVGATATTVLLTRPIDEHLVVVEDITEQKESTARHALVSRNSDSHQDVFPFLDFDMVAVFLMRLKLVARRKQRAAQAFKFLTVFILHDAFAIFLLKRS
ncbi:unnamed protein product [Phytophthora lilii]|uniref:Unnamed protein product n=1 Tax=Phytophthora lilii TaxID=2077276 RepID=A0A9W6WLU6_9STRA|nr:unnamed protein product [Phytophthora lilii]